MRVACFVLLCLSGVGLVPAPAREDKPKKHPTFPWHLVGVWVGLDDDREFDTLSADIQLLSEIPTTGNSLFIVPLSGTIGDEYFYVGISSQAMVAKSEKEAYTMVEGPGYHFTKFGEASAAIVSPAKGGQVLVSNHEGPHTGITFQQKNALALGRYTFTLTRMPKAEKEKAEKMSLAVTQHSRKVTTEIGTIMFNSPKANTLRSLAFFFEVTTTWDGEKKWWRDTNEHPFGDTVPECRLVVGNWRINGKKVSPTDARYAYFSHLPQKARVRAFSNIEKEIAAMIDKDLRDDKSILIETREKPFTRTEDEKELSGPGYRDKKIKAFFDYLYSDKER